MEKIVLSNGTEFTLITNGVIEQGDNLILRFLAGDSTVPTVQTAFDGIESVTIQNDDVVLASPYTEHTITKSVKLEMGVLIGEDITANVIEVVLAKPSIEQQVEQNTADIDYIAMGLGGEV